MTPDALLEATPERPVRLGHYAVLGLLGTGGMGHVFVAQSDHGGRVALKTLSHLQPDHLLRFKNEFRYAADLAHPNLVGLYELNHEGDLWFFTMELVEGVALGTWLTAPLWIDPSLGQMTTVARPVAATMEAGGSASGPAPAAGAPSRELRCDLGRLTGAVAQLVEALAHLHLNGIVHLDVKPSNVLVRADGRVQLLDLGVSTRVGERGASDALASVAGTPGYMSPEQWRGLPLSAASDCFSLGCLMFEALTGALPFAEGPAPGRETPRVEALVDGAPPALSALCHRLMAPEPADRATLEDVRTALGVAPPRASGESEPGLHFVGRVGERAALLEALQAARAGASVVVQVTGLSGMGKSTLMRSVFAEIRGAGDVTVLRGRCYERESVPYKAFDGLLDDLAASLSTAPDAAVGALLPQFTQELAQAFPALARVPAVALRLGEAEPVSALEMRRRALVALRQLFSNLAAQRPLALEIDDLQWIDTDSASLLLKLLEAPPRGLFLTLSYRSREALQNPAVAPVLAALRRLPSGRRVDVEVGPLGAAETMELARRLASTLALPESTVPRIAAESAGIPFFVEEMAHFVAQRAADPGADPDVPVTLANVLAERVRALPEADRTLVEVLAVANTPVALAAAFEAARIAEGALQCVVALRRGHFIHSFGVRAQDPLEIYHDRTRESVIARLSERQIREHHLNLGRALSRRHAGDAPGAWIYDTVRHLGAGAELITDPEERLEVARLHLVAGRVARGSAAFPLAFQALSAGVALLPADAWETAYALALGLHCGAAETGYLTAEWEEMARSIDAVKRHARSATDQILVWEVEIDAFAGRHQYDAAIESGLRALGLLGVHLPPTPGPAEIGAAVQHALSELSRIGPEGLAAIEDARDPEVLAAMRIQVRLSPAVFFARPPLLPIIACNLITTSIERGLSYATPNALALFGIILNAIGQYPIAHVWGQTAIRLIDRWEDRSLEAATRHVVFNLVCLWMQPLAGVLESSREVFDIGRRTGDFEYASYAAHTYVYLCLYVGRPLVPLLEEALALGEQMAVLGQINAVHVHLPIEQFLRCLTDTQADPARLDGNGFSEAEAQAMAEGAGSRSGVFIVRKFMGLARYYHGSAHEASAALEAARPYLDAAPSCWLVPVFHQFAALSGAATLSSLDPPERAALRVRIDESLEALRALTLHAPMNFAHRVSLVEAELRRVEGDLEGALARFDRAIVEAAAEGWVSEVALAHELAERCLRALGRPEAAAERRRTAASVYAGWGARAKARLLASPGEAGT